MVSCDDKYRLKTKKKSCVDVTNIYWSHLCFAGRNGNLNEQII